MIIPSFGEFAATPNLAQSYIAGANLQIARQKLAQDAQQAEMELMARQAAAHQADLRRDQEIEMEKAYKAATIGLQQRRLSEAEAELKLKVDAAAQKSLAIQQIQAGVDAGLDPQKLYQKYGPAAGRTPAGMFPKPADQPFVPRETQVGGQKLIQMSPNRFAFPPANSGPLEAKPIPGISPDEAVAVGNKIFKLQDPRKEILAQLKPLVERHETDQPGIQASVTKSSGKKLDDAAKGFLKAYEEREAEIKRLRKELDKLREKAASTSTATNQPVTLPEGLAGGGSTNQVGRFRVIAR